VLAQRTGIRHAEAHALVVLLRAEGMPAGLCYQRLTDEDQIRSSTVLSR
jgi:hypothetical protein